MKALIQHEGTGLPLRRSNVDTDQLYPARCVGNILKSGHQDALLAEWRLDPDFVMNRPEHQGATVMVAGPDFGTGSSREWAVWALLDYGFRVVLAPRFGDIFRTNAAANGLVAGVMPEEDIERLWQGIESSPAAHLLVDLETRTVTMGDVQLRFEFPDNFRWRIMNGLDDIDVTLRDRVSEIEEYESRRRLTMPSVPRRRVKS